MQIFAQAHYTQKIITGETNSCPLMRGVIGV